MIYHEHPVRKFLPTLERREPVIKDYSATKLLKECPLKYFLRMVVGKKRVKSDMETIFGWGTAVHLFMEKLYLLNGDFKEAFAAALKHYKPPKIDDKFSHLDMARFAQTCKALYEFYQKEQENKMVEIVGIEQPFNVALPDGTHIGGRFDMLFTRNGRLMIRDWKTTTKQANWFIPSLNPNDQPTRYTYAASRLAGWSTENPIKGKVDGVEFVIIENQKPNKSNAHPPKIVTTLVSKSHHDLIGWERDQIQVYKMLDLYRAADIWPRHENNCSWCDYNSVCRQPTEAAMTWELNNNYVTDFWDHTREDAAKGDD